MRWSIQHSELFLQCRRTQHLAGGPYQGEILVTYTCTHLVCGLRSGQMRASKRCCHSHITHTHTHTLEMTKRKRERGGNISAGSQRGHFLCTLTRHIPALRKNSSLFVPMRPDSREALRTISSPFGPTRPDSREEGKRTATVSETSGSCLAENISACTQPFSHSPVPRATASNNNTSSSAS